MPPSPLPQKDVDRRLLEQKKKSRRRNKSDKKMELDDLKREVEMVTAGFQSSLIQVYLHYRDVLNIRFVFASVPSSGPNSVFVFGRIVSSDEYE